MKRVKFCSFAISVVLGFLILGVIGCSQPASVVETKPEAKVETKSAVESKPVSKEEPKQPAKPESKPAATGEIKIGALLPYTGIGANVGKELERGLQFVLDKAGWEVAGRKIVLIREDETGDPSLAVAKAKKLVEQDKVNVVLGPLITNVALAVSSYLEPLGVPHISTGGGVPESKYTVFPVGNARQYSVSAGVFAYEELGARTAAILHMDYLFGNENKDAFTKGFTSKGGTISSVQALPMGTADTAPFLNNIGKVDVVAVLMVNPTDFAFVRQYREAGLKMPVIFITGIPQEEPLITRMGDNVLGMYGLVPYTPEIDTPDNKQFVQEYRTKFQAYPGIATVAGAYWAAEMYLQSVRSTGGDTSNAKINDVLKGIKGLKSPSGSLSITVGALGDHDNYAVKATKKGDRYVWDVVKKYPAGQP